jgi:exopolysaccharide production protein ExoZ
MERILSLQYLRGIAAMMVVFYHIHSRVVDMGYEGPWAHWMRGGVDIFFVISGFIMWVTTAGRSIGPARFYRKRIARIVPIYWIATSIVVLLSASLGWHALASYLFLPFVHPSGNVWPVLIVGWTLNYEMFFYAVFGAALLLPERLRIAAVAGVLGALVILGAIFDAAPEAEFYMNGIVLEFVAGMVIGRLWNEDARLRIGWAGIVSGFALFALLDPLDLPRFVGLGIPAVLIVLGALSLEPVRELPVLRALGDSSYSLYLFHGFALIVTAKIWTALGLHWLAFIPVALIGAGLAGYAMFRVVEQPVERHLRGVRKPLEPRPSF